MRAGAAARHLARMSPGEGVLLLAALISSGAEAWGTPAIAAIGQALRDPGPAVDYDWRAEAYAEARERGLPHVASLFLAPGPRRAFVEPRDKADPVAAVRLIAALARHVDAEARAAHTAVGQALVGPDAALLYEHLAEVYAVAATEELLEVTSLLVAPPAVREWVAPRDKADARLSRLTLGHKKTLARTHRDPDLLARLAAEGDPSVIRELLRNPLVTETVAARIAARRPVRPEALRALHEDPRFRNRVAVRRALARNPFVETEIALHILPTLPARLVEEIAGDGTLHPVVREAARRLLAERGG
jgi:hypothetical protein